MDIAATVNPATVHFRSLTDPDKLCVLEQNYEYDLLEPAKLLHKYVGREVTLVRSYQENGTTKHEEIKATLLSDNNGQVWKIGNDIVTGGYAESYRFPDIPANLYDRPTLLMSLENSGPRKQQIEASYLASNLSWNSDYVLTVARDDKSADLDGWVTLINNSGTAFHNARLQLVAGDLNRIAENGGLSADMVAREMAMNKAAAPQFQQESFSEYHLYTLGRRTSVEDQGNQADQPATRLRCPRQKNLRRQRPTTTTTATRKLPARPSKIPSWSITSSRMTKKPALAFLFPPATSASTRKIHAAASSSSAKTASTTRPRTKTSPSTSATPSTSSPSASRPTTSASTTHTWEMEFEITLRNHKDSPITVEVNEPIGGDWQMLSSTYKFTKTAAFAAQFQVPVAKDGTSVLRTASAPAGNSCVFPRRGTARRASLRFYTASATKIISGEVSTSGDRSKSPYTALTRNPHRASKCSTSYRKKYRSVHANTSRSSFPRASVT